MHVGAGDINYNIIDKEVEKDPVLKVPTIHSSGIKGALREHFKNFPDKNIIKKIFGSENDSEDKTQGSYKFMNANILSRPLRTSEGDVSYINVTSNEIINNFLSLINSFGIKKLGTFDLPKVIEVNFRENKFITNKENVTIEGEKTNIFSPEDKLIRELLELLIDGNFAITDAETFRSYDLPVIARNQLENGESKNLWYEEVVPHKSIFYFVILTPTDENELDFSKNDIVQFGGNASIGYGITKVSKVGCFYE
jgi:CRISPR-associated protein Cmr4